MPGGVEGKSRSSPAQRAARASDEARHITGVTMPVDAGQVIK
jgi:hypothetical protein